MKEFLTDKINNLPASATLSMAAKARELKNNGIDIIGLSLGEPDFNTCLLYTSPSPRDLSTSRMPSSA